MNESMYETIEIDELTDVSYDESPEVSGNVKSNTPTISVNEIADLIRSGKTRNEINEIYQFNFKEKKMVWSHPKLKGLKKGQPIRFELVD